MNVPVVVALSIVASYLIGSVPFGLLVGRWGGVDVRSQGSGNIGATNVGRLLGRRYGMLVFSLDVLKGLVPTLASGAVLGSLWADAQLAESVRYICWLGVGAAAVIGHNYPVYLRFRGGKGVSTSLGVTLGVYPELTFPALVALGVWLLVVVLSRYVSLGSICAGIALPTAYAIISTYRGRGLLAESWPLTIFVLLLACLVLTGHRSNVGRLLAGTEAKIGSKGKRQANQAGS